jgi:hypothetical protein
MSVNFSWAVTQLECLPNVENLQNYVIAAHWHCVAVEVSDDGSKHQVHKNGVCHFSTSKDDSFVPYENLSEAQVLDWVWANVGKQVIEDGLVQAVNELKAPSVISPKLPWE